MAESPLLIAMVGVGLAVLGYVFSRWIPEAPAPVPDLAVNLNPLAETINNLRFARRDPAILFALIGISWFWLYGALFLAQFPAYAQWLGGDETLVTLLLAVFTLGIGIGSLLCERLSGKRLQLGLVPFGAIGLTLFGLDFALATPSTAASGLSLASLLNTWSSWRLLIDLLLLGSFGGFFIVPLYALMQLQSPVEHRARIVAANNILNALFMVTGALGAAAALGQGVTLAELFAVAALGNGLLMFYLHRRQPAYWAAFRSWLQGKIPSP
jgi:MFS family permease